MGHNWPPELNQISEHRGWDVSCLFTISCLFTFAYSLRYYLFVIIQSGLALWHENE